MTSDELVDILKQVVFECEYTRAWDIMSDDLRGKIEVGIILIEAGMPLPSTASEETLAHLDQMLMAEFDSKDWSMTGRIMDTARSLRRFAVVEKMEKALKNEGHHVH